MDLAKLYANRLPLALRGRKAKVWKTIVDGFLVRYVPSNGVVLDVGAGYCDFINHVRAARRIAVDLNPEMPSFAAEGVETYIHALEKMTEILEPASVDLAFASNVFEHIRSPENLLEIFDALRQILKPDGRLVIMQPNVAVLGGRFWDFFDHTLPMTELGMTEGLELSGFQVVERRARFLPYTTKGRLPSWSWIVRLYLALPPAQWVFGKQMLVVARRVS